MIEPYKDPKTPAVPPEPRKPELSPEEQEAGFVSTGQRRVNIIWECTQAVIALMVTCVGMYTAAILAMRMDASESSKSMAITSFLLISNTVFLVIGFYFGRTNHQKVGGPADTNQTR